MERARIVPMFVLMSIFIMHPRIYANEEGEALNTFKGKLNDPLNVLQSWDPTLVNPCTWFHVTCNNKDKVKQLDLGNAQLSGELVPQLGSLSELEHLVLFQNNLNGPIPPELGNLSKLIVLDLGYNKLTGAIPGTLGKLSNLTELLLNDNNLSGRVPIEALAPIIPHLKLTNISNNQLLCTNYTDPPC